MLTMRRGRTHYKASYEKAMALHAQGRSIQDIATELKISYSCAYHWVRGLRKPEKSAVLDFVSFLREHGPTPVAEIGKVFAKHNECFLVAHRRSFPVRRYVLQRRFGDYATWYYLEGQEPLLRQRVAAFVKAYNETRRKLGAALESIDQTNVGKNNVRD